MQLVVRTSHGDAEVRVDDDGDALVADVIAQVVGDVVPAMIRIDGRAVRSSTPLVSSGAMVGSIISLVDDASAAGDPVVAEIVQTAGRGAGNRASLTSGEYALGPSRRVNVTDLSDAPVDDARIRIRLHDDGTVEVRRAESAGDPAAGDGIERPRAVLLDGQPLGTEATVWTSGPLSLGGRVFELRRGERPSPAARRFAGVGIDGTAAFNRPPRPAPTAADGPLVVPDGGVDASAARRGPTSEKRRRRRRDLTGSQSADTGAVADFRREAQARHRRERIRLNDAELDVDDIVDVAATASPRLWARRPGHADAFTVCVGLGNVDWRPELNRANRSLAAADTLLDELGPLHPAPITADLLAERGVGIVGDDEFATAMSRGLLLHACVAHGPADLDVVVLTSPERLASWEWTKWLPHVRTDGEPRLLSDDVEVRGWANGVANGWVRPTRPSAPNRITMVVVDEPRWWRHRAAPLRPLFADPTMPLRFVSITDSADDVPAVCTTLVAGEPGDTATVDYLVAGRTVTSVAPFLVSEEIAIGVARRLAPLDDPDLPVMSGAALPTVAPIARLLGLDLDHIGPEVIRDRWMSGRRPAAPAVVAGISDQGPVTIDLADDGPHCLIAGTHGTGKSELLRSLVVGLAANLPPDEINFVLVDATGGTAFGACATLPHTVGLVTALDEHLADRFLRSLRAELRHRETIVRTADATSFGEYQRIDGIAPLPRLVVVVDELASVADQCSEFVPSLVDIAQRGRSLGIHMIVATQRAGIDKTIGGKIVAGTDLRIALRVDDVGDSLDVVGSHDAAHLPRRVPGRAILRFASGDVTQFQSAYSNGVSAGVAIQRIDVSPYIVGRRPTPVESLMTRRAASRLDTKAGSAERRSDLERLVEAITTASDPLAQSDQRRPFPPPLPEHLGLDVFFARHEGDGVPLGLIDLPDEQRQAPLWWQPGPDGSLLVYGSAGAGTSSMLRSLGLGLARRCAADDVHLYVIDADTNTLSPLSDLPHCGAVVRLDEVERLGRLIRQLGAEVDRRASIAAEHGGARQVVSSEPTIAVLIDDMGALRQMLDDHRELDGIWQELERVICDGQPLGVCTIATARQERDVSASLAAQIPTRLVMRLGDRLAYGGFGFRPTDLPDFVPGRALRAGDCVEIQLVEPPAELAEHIAELGLEPATDRPPLNIAEAS